MFLTLSHFQASLTFGVKTGLPLEWSSVSSSHTLAYYGIPKLRIRNVFIVQTPKTYDSTGSKGSTRKYKTSLLCPGKHYTQ